MRKSIIIIKLSVLLLSFSPLSWLPLSLLPLSLLPHSLFPLCSHFLFCHFVRSSGLFDGGASSKNIPASYWGLQQLHLHSIPFLHLMLCFLRLSSLRSCFNGTLNPFIVVLCAEDDHLGQWKEALKSFCEQTHPH